MSLHEVIDQLTDTVLTGRGVPGEVRMNNRLYRMRVAVTEQLGASTGSPRSERVLAALRDPVLAGKAHELATMTPGVYEHNAVFYLSELGRTREAVQA